MMRRGLWIAVAVAVVVVMAGLLIFGSYVTAQKQMVAKQEAVQEQWANVQAVLQRRADLIPNLVATVMGYAQHEEAVFADVNTAREALLEARGTRDKIQANQQLDRALGHLLAISENYPELKANQNFLELQDQLESTANRIALERNRYNQTVREYNTYIRQIPNNFWARLAGFYPDTVYFEASPASQSAPAVKF